MNDFITLNNFLADFLHIRLTDFLAKSLTDFLNINKTREPTEPLQEQLKIFLGQIKNRYQYRYSLK